DASSVPVAVNVIGLPPPLTSITEENDRDVRVGAVVSACPPATVIEVGVPRVDSSAAVYTRLLPTWSVMSTCSIGYSSGALKGEIVNVVAVCPSLQVSGKLPSA